MPEAKPPRDANGILFREGQIVRTRADGLLGRVCEIHGNAVLYETFGHQGISDDQPIGAVCTPEDLTVVIPSTCGDTLPGFRFAKELSDPEARPDLRLAMLEKLMHLPIVLSDWMLCVDGEGCFAHLSKREVREVERMVGELFRRFADWRRRYQEEVPAESAKELPHKRTEVRGKGRGQRTDKELVEKIPQVRKPRKEARR